MGQEDNKGIVQKALDVFVSPFGEKDIREDQTKDFTTWFLHDYRYKGQSIFQVNGIESSFLEVVEGSLVSIFKVNYENNNMVFKDILTNKDYKIESDQFLMMVTLYR